MITLNLDEKQSPVWQKVIDHCESRIQVLQRVLETDGDFDSINRARGAIKEIRAILGASHEKPMQEPDPMQLY